MILIEALARFLHSRGIGVYRDSDQPLRADELGIYLESLPPISGMGIVIYQYAGTTVSSKLTVDEPRIQFAVHGSQDSMDSRQIATRISDLMNGLCRIDMSGVWIVSTLVIFSGPVFVGFDDNGRSVHVVNCEVSFSNRERRS